MISNYIKIAWRNIQRHKIFSAINIIGLALSLTAFWLIALFIAEELSYDQYHAKAKDIYRVVSNGKWDGGGFDITGTSGPMAKALKSEYPEIEQTLRINTEGGGVITYKQQKLKEDNIFLTDNSFFGIFSYRFLAGDPHTALAKPQSIVLTNTLAVKLFGSAEAALNKTIYFDGNFPNQVTGVMEDVPQNSHFTFTALRSFPANYTTDWGDFSLYTYILLQKNADSGGLKSKLPRFAHKYFQPQMADVKYALKLQPLTSIHLHSHLGYELGNNRSVKYLYALAIVGLLILLIAFINYINITTARVSVRLREVAIRKIVGSDRKNLISLFLAESVMVILVAAAISMLLMTAVMPFFNEITGKILTVWRFGVVETFLSLGFFSLFSGLIGGLYPALFLSGFKTIPSLKNQMGNQQTQIIFRKSLVVFQFTVTVVMIAVSLVIYSQLRYVLHKDLGFDKNQLLTFHIDAQSVRKNVPALKTALLQNPLIKNVAVAGNPIGNNNIGLLDYNVEKNGAMSPNTNLGYGLQVDEGFIPTLDIKLSQGCNFIQGMSTDSSQSVIVNETLIRKEGWKNAIGKRIKYEDKSAIIIGVIKDFHIYSLQHKIGPMILHLPATVQEKDNVYVRIDAQNVKKSLKFIEATFQKFDQESPWEYHFLDQNFARQYVGEQKQGQILLSFTLLAIGIACLGLFGLITFTTRQRVKEIGIRKVLGANVASLAKLLSADLLKLVLLAMIIASPIAWFVMSMWLQDFASRIELHWWMVALAGVIALSIALITVSFQAIKAAVANPVKSLRSE